MTGYQMARRMAQRMGCDCVPVTETEECDGYEKMFLVHERDCNLRMLYFAQSARWN